GLAARTATWSSGCGLPRASSGSQFCPALCGATRRLPKTRWRRTSVEFGCHLPVFGPAATRANLLTFAREMERLGYESLWASDHIVVPHAISSRYPYNATGQFPLPPDATFLEPLTALGMVAAVTERGGLGNTLPVPPRRPPRLPAQAPAPPRPPHRSPGHVGGGAG